MLTLYILVLYLSGGFILFFKIALIFTIGLYFIGMYIKYQNDSDSVQELVTETEPETETEEHVYIPSDVIPVL